jgi:hypothetical protein
MQIKMEELTTDMQSKKRMIADLMSAERRHLSQIEAVWSHLSKWRFVYTPSRADTEMNLVDGERVVEALKGIDRG